MKKEIPMPLIVAAVAFVVIFVGVFLYKAATGGQVGQGPAGTMEAAPPSPNGGAGRTPGAPPGFKGAH